jgi:tetratricopeptide (TPR) repeat protein/S1-C subfamily serine protease
MQPFLRHSAVSSLVLGSWVTALSVGVPIATAESKISAGQKQPAPQARLLLGQLSAEEYVRRGNNRFNQGDYRGAIADFTQAIALDPRNAVAYAGRGAARNVLGDFQAAISDLNRSIAINSNDPIAYNNRGFSRFGIKDYRGSIADYSMAIQLNPRDARYYAGRGAAYNELGDYQTALLDLNQSIRLDSTNGIAYNNRGFSNTNLRNYQAAEFDYTQAMKYNPQENKDYFARRGNARVGMKDYQGAIADTTQAIQMNSRNAYAYSVRADALLGLKNYRAALVDIDRALQLDPGYKHAMQQRQIARAGLGQSPDTALPKTPIYSTKPSPGGSGSLPSGKSADDYIQSGNTRFSQKDFRGAITDFTQAIALNPQSALAYSGRGASYNELGDYKAALEDLNQSLRLDGTNGITHNNRGYTNTSLGNFRAAESDYTLAIKYNPQETKNYLARRGNARFRLQDYQGAIADTTQALQMNSQNAYAYSVRADAKIGLKNYQSAIADLNQAVQLDPKYSYAFNQRATANLSLKNYRQALSDADQSLQINPRFNYDATFSRGVAKIGVGDFQGAVADLTDALTVVTPKAHYYRGLAYYRLGNNQQAIAEYDRALKLSPNLLSEADLDNFNEPRLRDYAALARGGTSGKVATAPADLPRTPPEVQPKVEPKAPPSSAKTTPPEPDRTTVVSTSSGPTEVIPSSGQNASGPNVYKTASEITVLISGQNPGSGVIFARTNDTYYVLTAKHVVATPDEYQVVTSDRKQYTIDYSKVKKLPAIDLAVVQFTSNQSYPVARLGNSEQVQQGANVYASGWPIPEGAIKQATNLITEGRIAGFQRGEAEGYELLYGNATAPGMSGGPVIDANGLVIGIHGRAAGNEVSGKVGINLGIPINLFLRSASQIGLNLQQLGLRAER